MPVVNVLFIKAESGKPMLPVPSFHLIEGFGIEGDVNAHSYSPRQVLVVRQEELDHFKIPAGGLKENILIEGLSFDEFQPGDALIAPSGAELRLTMQCEPCKLIGHLVPSYKEIRNHRGILAVVIRSGDIFQGDKLIHQSKVYEPLPEIPYERFVEFIKRIPRGKVATYKDVAIGMGESEGFIRAIPGYINKSKDLPVHRIVDSTGALIKSVADQQKKLAAENITFQPQDPDSIRVNLEQHQWIPWKP